MKKKTKKPLKRKTQIFLWILLYLLVLLFFDYVKFCVERAL